MNENDLCAECFGLGTIEDELGQEWTCPHCAGTGYIPVDVDFDLLDDDDPTSSKTA